MRGRLITLHAGLALPLAGQLAHPGESVINDRTALTELKTGKEVFLVNIGDTRKLNFYLEVIQGNYGPYLL